MNRAVHPPLPYIHAECNAEVSGHPGQELRLPASEQARILN